MISPSRRKFLSSTAALAATAALAPLRAARAQGASKKTRLVLLGTGGGPRVIPNGRAKSANLIVANGVPYVVDCGEGVAHQLVRAGVALNTLRYVFITHHHSDHNLDYGNLIHDSWAAGLRAPVDTYGPPPIKAMTEAYWKLNRFDIETLLKRVPNAATLREHLLASHIVTEDLGKLAAAAGVKTLVLTHLVPPDDNSITDDMWMEGVRKHYGGTIIVGRDLLEI